MLVDVRVRLDAVPVGWVRMLVVLVMHMSVTVCERRVDMLVGMMFGQVQPDADGHAGGRDPENHPSALSKQRDGEDAADEGSRGKVGARARRSQVTERIHEQNQADAIAKESQPKRREDQ